MCAYQRIDDEPCCGSNRLLQTILRDDRGFKHIIVSDCGAVTDFYTSDVAATATITQPMKLTTAGDHEFASGVKLEGFSASLETEFIAPETPRTSGRSAYG